MMASDVPVIYRDDFLVACDKPSGLLSVPGRGPEKADCLSARVQAVYGDALIVHRLDQPTSGVIVFARGIEMQRRLSSAFERRRVHKQYVGVVAGSMPQDGTIDLPLGTDWDRRPLQKVDVARGKPALTRWHAVGPGKASAAAPCTRVTLLPLTGRTHQLRVHLSAIGHPLLGDALYAPPAIATAAPRLLLHAESLDLVHPASGLPLHLHAPAPF